MIKSSEGVENAEEILRVDGVSGIFISPQNLRLSLGLPAGRDGSEPLFNNAIKKVLSIAKRLGKPVGSKGIGTELAQKQARNGMGFLKASTDASALTNGLLNDLKAVRNLR